MTSVQIRDFAAPDWAVLYPVFTAIVDAGETYAYPPGLSSDEALRVWVDPPPARTVVAELDGRVVGTARVGPNRPGRGAHVATASFMVDPAVHGRGVGRALGEHVLELARRDGYRSMQFNAVVETNTGAVTLWRSLGFEIMTTIPEAFDHAQHGLVGLHVMWRRLP